MQCQEWKDKTNREEKCRPPGKSHIHLGPIRRDERYDKHVWLHILALNSAGLRKIQNLETGIGKTRSDRHGDWSDLNVATRDYSSYASHAGTLTTSYRHLLHEPRGRESRRGSIGRYLHSVFETLRSTSDALEEMSRWILTCGSEMATGSSVRELAGV